MVLGLLIVVASLVTEQALGIWASVVVAHGLSSCDERAEFLHGMWDLLRPGIELMFLLLEVDS